MDMPPTMDREIGEIKTALASMDERFGRFEDRMGRFEDKFDKHVENYSSLKVDVAKVAGTVGLIVTIGLTLAKEALAAVFHKQ
jgi:DNA anti-recombination protein RmuC